MTALITGGTSGIGAAFARHLAASGTDLVLVARTPERLTAFAEELSAQYGIDVETFPADLADRDEVTRVQQRLEDPDRPIEMFINNAGFGLHKDLLIEDTSTDERAFDVMIRAVYLLGGAAARAMRNRGHGTIITTSSSSGYVTMGNYSAIKSWVTTWAESLATQLKGTGVSVVAICPGWVHTEFHDRAGINQGSIPDWAWVDVDEVVRDGLRAAATGRVISVASVPWKIAVTLARIAPRGIIRAVSRKLTAKRQ